MKTMHSYYTVLILVKPLKILRKIPVASVEIQYIQFRFQHLNDIGSQVMNNYEKKGYLTQGRQ